MGLASFIFLTSGYFLNLFLYLICVIPHYYVGSFVPIYNETERLANNLRYFFLTDFYFLATNYSILVIVEMDFLTP